MSFIRGLIDYLSGIDNITDKDGFFKRERAFERNMGTSRRGIRFNDAVSYFHQFFIPIATQASVTAAEAVMAYNYLSHDKPFYASVTIAAGELIRLISKKWLAYYKKTLRSEMDKRKASLLYEDDLEKILPEPKEKPYWETEGDDWTRGGGIFNKDDD